MALKIRLSRGGAKKRPYYRIVVTQDTSPRDGKYIERLGAYDPMQPKGSDARLKMDIERIEYWMGQGAQPTDRIKKFLEAEGKLAKTERNNPNKAKPKAKAQERLKEKAAEAEAKAEAAKQAEEEAKAAAEAPAEEAATEEAPAAEAESAPEEATEAPAEEEKKDESAA